MNSIILYETNILYCSFHKTHEIYGYVIGESTDFNISISEINPYDFQLTNVLTHQVVAVPYQIQILALNKKQWIGLPTLLKLPIRLMMVILLPKTLLALESDESEVYNFDENIDFEIGGLIQSKHGLVLTMTAITTTTPLAKLFYNSTNCTFPYHEDFEVNILAGLLLAQTHRGSWARPMAQLLVLPGTNAWATSGQVITMTENSWVASPCFI